jgi:hypothetical protein
VHSRFDLFRATPLGQQLEALIDAPHRYLEYAALSRAEVPAVTAIVHDLTSRFSEVAEDHTARQFCGAMVAEVMRRHHHTIAKPRGRVIGNLFTYGVVWSPAPHRKAMTELIAALEEMPGALARVLDRLPRQSRLFRPPGSGMSAVEHVCHLRDLESEGYHVRIERVLTQDAPELIEIDGTAWASERDYQSQSFEAAFDSFRQTRTLVVELLRGISVDDYPRYGLFRGVKRMTVTDLVLMMHDHDQTHLQEFDELLVELGIDGGVAGQISA